VFIVVPDTMVFHLIICSKDEKVLRVIDARELNSDTLN